MLESLKTIVFIIVEFLRITSEDDNIEDELSNKESRKLFVELILILVELLLVNN